LSLQFSLLPPKEIKKIRTQVISKKEKASKIQEKQNQVTFLARASAFLCFCLIFFFCEAGKFDISPSSSAADFEGESYNFM